MQKNLSGFTLVELLVVIVTISILSTITVVAYSNIQNRAKNTQITTAVSQYLKALKLYAVDYGSIDSILGSFDGNTICLGDDTSYPASTTYASNGTGECGWLNGGTTIKTNPTLAAPLLKYMGNKNPTFTAVGGYYQAGRGIHLVTFPWGGGQFFYFLNGNAECHPGFQKGSVSGNTSCGTALARDGSIVPF